MLKLIFDKRDLFTCISLVVMIIFTIVKVLALSGVTFYPRIYRTTYEYSFNTSLTSSFLLDALIILLAGLFVINVNVAKKFRFFSVAASTALAYTSIMLTLYMNKSVLDITGIALLLFIAALMFFKHPSSGSPLIRPVNLIFLALALTASVFILEITSIVRWITHPIFPSKIYGDWTWSATYLESSLFYVLGLLSPYVMLALLFSFFWRSKTIRNLTNIVTNKLASTRYLIFSGPVNMEAKTISDSELIRNLIKKPSYQFWMVISFMLAIFFAIYPYLPSTNPENMPLGDDLIHYIAWIKQLRHYDAEEITRMVFTSFNGGDRPLTILLIYAIYSFTSLPVETIVQFLPLALGPALVIAVYYFVRLGTGNNKQLAGISAMMTVVSYYFIVGMYTGLLANWLALVAVFVSLMILVRTFEKPSFVGYTLLMLTTLTTLFIHVYTWGYFISSIILYLILSYAFFRKERQKLRNIIFLAIIVGVNIAVTTGGIVTTRGIEGSSVIASEKIAFENLFLFWENLNYDFHYWAGGYFTNFVMLALAFIWTLSARFSSNFDRLLLSTLYIGIIPVLFGDLVIQTRIFYNMPVQIPAAIVLYRLMNAKSHENRDTRFPHLFYTLLFYSIILHLLNYGFRAVANLYLT